MYIYVYICIYACVCVYTCIRVHKHNQPLPNTHKHIRTHNTQVTSKIKRAEKAAEEQAREDSPKDDTHKDSTSQNDSQKDSTAQDDKQLKQLVQDIEQTDLQDLKRRSVRLKIQLRGLTIIRRHAQHTPRHLEQKSVFTKCEFDSPHSSFDSSEAHSRTHSPTHCSTPRSSMHSQGQSQQKGRDPGIEEPLFLSTSPTIQAQGIRVFLWVLVRMCGCVSDCTRMSTCKGVCVFLLCACVCVYSFE